MVVSCRCRLSDLTVFDSCGKGFLFFFELGPLGRWDLIWDACYDVGTAVLFFLSETVSEWLGSLSQNRLNLVSFFSIIFVVFPKVRSIIKQRFTSIVEFVLARFARLT